MKPSNMIDPKVLQVDVLELLAPRKLAGAAAGTIAGLLASQEAYATYPDDYIFEWVVSMLEKLAGQGLVVLKGGHYFPVKPAEKAVS
jgi:hypothetical protein